MADVTVNTSKNVTKVCRVRQNRSHYILAGGHNGEPYYYKPANPASSSSDGTLGTTTVRSWTKRSVRTDGWYGKVSQGQRIPDKPFTYTADWRYPGQLHTRGQTGSGSNITRYNSSADSEWYQNWTLTPKGTASPLTRFSLQAKLLDKQRGNQWQAPVFFIEGKKTADMVVNRAADLVWLVRSLRSGRLDDFFDALRGTWSSAERRKIWSNYNRDRKVSGHSKASANVWLETQYGWVPLMSDVYDATHALMDLSEHETALYGVTRRKISSTRSYKLWGRDALADTAMWTHVQDSLNAVWHWKPKAGYIPSRFSLTNPASVAWELLPYSFVADWFVPIGDYLQFLDTPFTVDHVGGSYGTRREIRVTEQYGVGSTTVSGIGSTRMVYVNRAPMTAIPVPKLADLWNEFEQGLHGKRVINALALLRQNLRFLDGKR